MSYKILKEMVITNKISRVFLYLSLLIFISFVIYILCINQEVFFTAHDRSEFLYGVPFFSTLMSKPFGLIQYIGAWLTQLLYYPALGTTVLMAIWILIYIVGVKAFRLQGSSSSLMFIPIACLLLSLVDLGYWIYVSPIRGYWFSQSIGYLVMLLLVWVARSTSRKWHLVWYLIGFCLYPILGWFALLFVFCLAITEKITWREIVGIILILFAAVIWHKLLYSDCKIDAIILAGLPRFVTGSDNTKHLTNPFWILGGVSIFIPLCGRYLSKWFVPGVCACVSIFFVWSLMFHDKNYIDEMRMVRYAENDNWKEVLRLAEENNKPTTTMIFLKNLALMNEGGLLERSFKMGNISTPINNPDTIHVSLLEIAAPLVYYNYGLLNEAIRLGYENGIQEGFSPINLKMLSRCTLATGESKLNSRFLTMLHHRPFYGEWQPAPVTANVRELSKSYFDELTGIENSDSYLVNNISQWNNIDNKKGSEQALFYAMIRRDSRRFWAALRKFVKSHSNEEFPIHAQEAYILYMDKSPEEKKMMLPINQDVYNRYQSFWAALESEYKPGMTQKDLGDKLYNKFGDTYWYYNIFCTKVY